MDIDNLIEKNNFIYSNELEYNQIERFEDIEDIKENLLKNILLNYKSPSQLQSLVFKSILNKRDLIAQSVGGTGKTLCCIITALQVIDENLNKPQVLILNPTVELSLCLYNSIKQIGNYLSEDNFLFAVVGTSRVDNLVRLGGLDSIKNPNNPNNLKNLAKIVIGTPGRTSDLIQNHPELFDSVRLVLVEESDEIISGFCEESFKGILSGLKDGYQLGLFASSLSEKTKTIADSLLTNPVKIFQSRQGVTMDMIKQTYLVTTQPKELIFNILTNKNIKNYIIYVNSDEKILELKKYFDSMYLEINFINSKTDNLEINKIINKLNNSLKNGIITSNILLIKRINIPNVNLILNWDLIKKDNIEIYMHQIIKNKSVNKKRLVINFVQNESDLEVIKNIENTFQTKISEFINDDFDYIK